MTALTKLENMVDDDNLKSFMRYLRLQCPYDGQKKLWWIDQANKNIPALILASLELPTDRKIHFTYRDCVFFHQIYEKVTGNKGYRFDTSRVMYWMKNKFFNEYV